MEFFHEDRLRRLIGELAELRYRDRRPLGAFACYEDDGAVGRCAPDPAAHRGSMQVGDRWSGRDRYLWLVCTVDLPEKWLSRDVAGLFDFGRTGEGNNAGFEALLLVGGRPCQGVDVNHREVLFDPRETGPRLELAFRLWSGLEGGGAPREQHHELRQAELAWLDAACDDLYFTAQAVLATVETLDEHAPERSLLLNLLNRAFRKVDFARPGSEAFHASVAEARDFLAGALAEQHREAQVTVTCVGHTHIDLAWLWRLRHTREKAARSFSTADRLMRRYGELAFVQSQAQLYEYVKQDYPVVYEWIRDWIRAGRWEAGGAMWVEADCNIPSGEALVRQITYGIRFFAREFGVSSTYLWLPDVFGYNWALPQILRQCGLGTFITTKISWNEHNKLPHDTFIWRGIDGSEVTAHFITVPDAGNPESRYYTYNGLLEPATVSGAWRKYADKAINRELLLAYGYGDGGGGPNRHMLEMRRRLERMPGMPNTRTGRVDDYVRRLNEAIHADHGGYLHVWDGELYLEYHRGTYTSQAYSKWINRRLEVRYREAEFVCALAAIAGNDWGRYPQESILDGWKIVLRNQFHDIIPGSAIREVYEDSREEYAQADTIAAQCTGDALAHVAQGGEGTFTVFNSASWERSGLVRLPLAGFDGSICDERGNPLPMQREADGVLVHAAGIPPLGPVRFRAVEEAAPAAATPFRLEGNRVETPYYLLEWDGQGHICRLLDRLADREVLAEDESANVMQVFEDKPRQYDAWELEVSFEQKREVVCDFLGAEVQSQGALLISIRFRWRYRDSCIDQDMVLYRDSPRIDLRTTIDWQEREKLLKVAFPVRIRSTEATYDIQFGNIKRPTHRNTSWDHARFEVVGHQWADLSEEGYGVALLNDGKYGYDIRDHRMRLTLLKSANYPDPQADAGEHRFTYSLLPHAGSWQDAGVVRLAWDLNSPLYAAAGAVDDTVNGRSLLVCDNPNVMVDAVKKAEDSDRLVVRLHEFAGSRGPLVLQSGYRLASWQPCDLLERPTGPEQHGAAVADYISPYQIKTYLLTVHP